MSSESDPEVVVRRKRVPKRVPAPDTARAGGSMSDPPPGLRDIIDPPPGRSADAQYGQYQPERVQEIGTDPPDFANNGAWGNTNSIRILNNLPRFRGTARHDEKHFVPGITLQTFLGSMDAHFVQHGITDDTEKLRIMFAQIEKETGTAVDIVRYFER